MDVHLHRNAPPLARWRVTCVDGLLHVAYTAAVAAESAAHRCVERLDDARPTARRRGPLGMRARGQRKDRRPVAARTGQRSRRRHGS
jgi:hypothetical protein